MERSTFTAAVAAAPEDDLPRLIVADSLDDQGDSAWAEFIRAQVRLAACDPWDRFAVYCQHHRPEWVQGQPWRFTLPRVDGFGLEWHPVRAFRRGFGYALIVRDVRWWLAEAPRLVSEAPIGELHLPTATLEEWRAFARADWLPRLQSVHFYGTTTPVEPLRELMASAKATGITEIVFEKASGAGLPVLLEDLFASPLGRQLRSLELRVGPDPPDDLYDVLLAANLPNLSRLSLITLTQPTPGWAAFYRSPIIQGLQQLTFVNVPGVRPPPRESWPRLDRFEASNCGWSTLGESEHDLTRFRQVLLNGNPFCTWSGFPVASDLASGQESRLLSLQLRKTQLSGEGLDRWLTESTFWPSLVELDLRENHVTDAAAEPLLRVVPPSDLTAILLGGNRLSSRMEHRLRDHFGDALVT